MQENKGHYTGPESNQTRRLIYSLWKDINKLGSINYRYSAVDLNLSEYVLVNSSRDHRKMSTQLTGNTCYFQSYLFGLLCKAGGLSLSRDGGGIEVGSVDRLKEACIRVSRFLLEFFVDENAGVLRPLTNCNVLLDFYRYTDSAYFALFTRFLQSQSLSVPEYKLQYEALLRYYVETRTLHTYTRFQESAAMPSTINSKSLQPVCDTDGSLHKVSPKA